MKFLHLKAWQLFVLSFILPFVIYLIGMLIFMAKIIQAEMSNSNPRFGTFDFILVGLIGLVAMLGVVIHQAWFFNVGTKLQAYMNPSMRPLNVRRFRILFLMPWIYLLLLSVILPISINYAVDHQTFPAALFAFIIPGHLFMAFCLIYSLYFVAKTVKSAQLGREAHFSDYIGEFFLLWFWPVGIWFVQPVVHQVIGQQATQNQVIDSDHWSDE